MRGGGTGKRVIALRLGLDDGRAAPPLPARTFATKCEAVQTTASLRLPPLRNLFFCFLFPRSAGRPGHVKYGRSRGVDMQLGSVVECSGTSAGVRAYRTLTKNGGQKKFKHVRTSETR